MTPIFVSFSVTIGMVMDFSLFNVVWLAETVYCVGRDIGEIIGCAPGGAMAGPEPRVKKYLGFAMLPKAGVAMGLAALAAQALSGHELGDTVVTVTTTTTMVFGLLSPPPVQYAAKMAGEASV